MPQPDCICETYRYDAHSSLQSDHFSIQTLRAITKACASFAMSHAESRHPTPMPNAQLFTPQHKPIICTSVTV